MTLTPPAPASHRPSTALAPALDSQALFWKPHFMPGGAGVHRVPLLFWVMDVLRPQRVVYLGLGDGQGYFALCQAAERLHLGTEFLATAAEADPALLDLNAQRHAAVSRIVSGDAGPALARLAPGSVDLLVIDADDLAADDRAARIAALAALLSSRAMVVAPDAADLADAFAGLRPIRLRLGAQDVLVLVGAAAAAGDADPRLVALATSQDGSSLRHDLQSAFHRLGSALWHEANSQTAAPRLSQAETDLAALTESLTAAQRAQAELAAAYGERNRQMALMQARSFDLLTERDQARAEVARLETLLKAAEASAAELAAARTGLEAAAQREAVLNQQIALRFQELAVLTEELEKRAPAPAAASARRADDDDDDETDSALERAEELEGQLLEAQRDIATLTRELERTKDLRKRLQRMESSTSWKVTAPLRLVSKAARKLTGRR